MKTGKRIELRLKSIINSFLENKNEPAIIQEDNYFKNLSDNCKILILRQDRIGDVLISTPFIRALRAKFPNAQIDIILSEKNYSAKRAVEYYIDNIWIYKKNITEIISLIRKLNKIKYELIIDLFDNPSTTSSLLIKFIKSQYTLGLDKDNRNIYTHVVPLLQKSNHHIIERVNKLLEAFGINPDEIDSSLEYKILDDEKLFANNLIGNKNKELRLGINLSGSSEAKFWGNENYIEFINTINNYYNNIEILIFAEKRLADIAELISGATNTKIAPYVSTVHEFAILLSECNIILSPDTSAVHFAVAMNIPCIALYSVVDINKFGMAWTPYNSSSRAIITNKPSLSEISVKEVFETFRQMIIDK